MLASLNRTRRALSTAAEPALPGYVGPFGLRRWRLALLLGFVALLTVYGFLWAAWGAYVLLPLLALPAAMLLLIIWLLPDTERPPAELTWKLFVAFLVAHLIWPDYLAISLPGLPWLTMIRIIGLPLVLAFLVCLSVSPHARKHIAETLNATPMVWRFAAVFFGLTVVTAAFSNDLGFSLNRVTVAWTNWLLIFLVATWLFRKVERFETLLHVMLFAVFVICLIALWEAQLGQLPWIGHIPSFLAIDDPDVARILEPKSRAAEGILRVQSKFTTPLGLAEVIAVACPLLVHLAATPRHMAVRVLAAVALPLSAYVVYLSDSRLGVVGIAAAALLLFLSFGIERWRERRDSLLAPIILISYPALGAIFIASTFLVGRIRNMFWGGGAEQYSTDSRKSQYIDGFERIMAQPWGYGAGRGAGVLDAKNSAGNVTIDTYYILIGIEYGVLGFIAFYGIFFAAITYGIRTWLNTRGRVETLIAPLTISLVVFLIIKLVFAQQENHPLIFALLGAYVALIWYARQNAQGAPYKG